MVIKSINKQNGVSGMSTLHIFGPGGPYRPMSECSSEFAAGKNVNAVVTKGTPQSWIEQARHGSPIRLSMPG